MNIHVHSQSLSNETLGQFQVITVHAFVQHSSFGEYCTFEQVVVLTDSTIELALKINDYCHANNVCFLSTQSRGVFGNIFVDFGPKFVIHDTNGENPLSCMISSITQVLDNSTFRYLNNFLFDAATSFKSMQSKFGDYFIMTTEIRKSTIQFNRSSGH